MPQRFWLSAAGGEKKLALARSFHVSSVVSPEPARDDRSARADLRFGAGPDGQVFLLNKHDGTIRVLVPDAR